MLQRAWMVAAAVAAVGVLQPSSAAAQWRPLARAGAGFLSAVATPAEGNGSSVATVGATISGGFPPSINLELHVSADGGASWANRSAGLSGERFALPTAVAMASASAIWVAVGGTLNRSGDGGQSWQQSDAGADVLAMHFFDESDGVLVGAGGRAWVTSDGGATLRAAVIAGGGVRADLRHVQMLDRETGFATGYALRTEEDFNGEEERFAEAGVVLRTADGGASWSVATELGDVGVGPAFFLPDAGTGFLATFEYAETSGGDARATLWRSTEGGARWEDMGLPLVVGEVSGRFVMEDIETSFVLAQHWDDANNGRLAALAHLSDAQSGMSGGGSSSTQRSSFYALIDYRTSDGGASWAQTDLGMLPFSLTNPPRGQGDLKAGVLRNIDQGWVVGSEGAVFGLGSPGAGNGGGNGDGNGGNGDGNNTGDGNNGNNTGDGNNGDGNAGNGNGADNGAGNDTGNNGASNGGANSLGGVGDEAGGGGGGCQAAPLPGLLWPLALALGLARRRRS